MGLIAAIHRRTNCYARISGNLNYTNNAYSINIHHIERVSSMNTVIAHFLDGIVSFLHFRGKNASAPPASEITGTPSDLSTTIEMMVLQALQSILATNPGGASLDSITSALTTYGMTGEQVVWVLGLCMMRRSALGDMERERKVYKVDASTYMLSA